MTRRASPGAENGGGRPPRARATARASRRVARDARALATRRTRSRRSTPPWNGVERGSSVRVSTRSARGTTAGDARATLDESREERPRGETTDRSRGFGIHGGDLHATDG